MLLRASNNQFLLPNREQLNSDHFHTAECLLQKCCRHKQYYHTFCVESKHTIRYQYAFDINLIHETTRRIEYIQLSIRDLQYILWN
jgi:S-ribosylhomocysteine lyase LuxS involved in autoinducer biosynthesis